MHETKPNWLEQAIFIKPTIGTHHGEVGELTVLLDYSPKNSSPSVLQWKFLFSSDGTIALQYLRIKCDICSRRAWLVQRRVCRLLSMLQSSGVEVAKWACGGAGRGVAVWRGRRRLAAAPIVIGDLRHGGDAQHGREEHLRRRSAVAVVAAPAELSPHVRRRWLAPGQHRGTSPAICCSRRRLIETPV
jgi:hypothetical protein